MKGVFFAIFLTISVVCNASGITDADLAAEYDKAFYANNYLLAESWIDVLLVRDPGNLDYQREKAKILALSGKITEFLAAMIQLRTINTPKALENFFQVVDFPNISLQALKGLKAVFVNDKFITSRWGSKPRSFQPQDIDPNFSGVQVPDFIKARDEARKKACIANMRVLTGAIEMYNMGNSTMLSSIDSNTITMLVTEGHLKSDLNQPTPQCKYYSEGDLSGLGVVACPFHGPCPGSN